MNNTYMFSLSESRPSLMNSVILFIDMCITTIQYVTHHMIYPRYIIY